MKNLSLDEHLQDLKKRGVTGMSFFFRDIANANPETLTSEIKLFLSMMNKESTETIEIDETKTRI